MQLKRKSAVSSEGRKRRGSPATNPSSMFYKTFKDKYDIMISQKRYAAEMPFFTSVFERFGVKTVLDCACGTGWHAIHLSKMGYRVSGCDISGDMVDIAKSNSSSVQFIQSDFKKLDDSFKDKFDCVMCWGNSLGHELEERGILAALRSMRRMLKDKGILIIQIRNLPKFVKGRNRIFPMHYHKAPNGDVKLFVYVLDFHRTTVTYNVLSFIEAKGRPKFEVDSSEYRIVSAARLRALMAKAGFTALEFYGDSSFTKFNEGSDDIIVIARK